MNPVDLYRSRIGFGFPQPAQPVEVSRVAVTTAPKTRPALLARVRDNINVPDDGSDTRLGEALDGASDEIQTDLGRALCTQTLTLKLDAFPRLERSIELPRPPLQSVTSVKYSPVDTGVEVTLSSDAYIVNTASEPGRITLNQDHDWPDDDLIAANGVSIEYVAGYGVAADPSNVATFNISAGTVKWLDHPLSVGDAVSFSGGTLPAEIAADAIYYVRDLGEDSDFKLAATRGGTALALTGSPTGTHTATARDGRPAAMPQKLYQALMLLVGARFDHQEPPDAYYAIIAKHAIGVIV